MAEGPSPSKTVLVIILGGLISIGAVHSLLYSGENSAAAARREAAANAECQKNLQCWGDKFAIKADRACSSAVEHLAKYESKWKRGWPYRFSDMGWGDLEHKTLRYMGDDVLFQNGFGAFQQYHYTCFFDTESGTVESVNAHPGFIN